MRILKIIEEIKLANQKTPNELFEELLTDRLNLSLKSYYLDIESKLNYYENRLNKIK